MTDSLYAIQVYGVNVGHGKDAEQKLHSNLWRHHDQCYNNTGTKFYTKSEGEFKTFEAFFSHPAAFDPYIYKAIDSL